MGDRETWHSQYLQVKLTPMLRRFNMFSYKGNLYTPCKCKVSVSAMLVLEFCPRNLENEIFFKKYINRSQSRFYSIDFDSIYIYLFKYI